MSRDSKLPDKLLQRTPDTIEDESVMAQSTRQQAQGELAEAIAITEAIISKHQQAGPVDSNAIYAEVAGIFETESAERTKEALVDLTDRFHYFISGGRKALETELGYLERNEQIIEARKQWEREKLQHQYTEAKVMEKMAIVRVADLLLHRFMDPYARFDDLVTLTHSTQNEAGQWSSEFDPATLAPDTKRLISSQSVQEIRAGIQLALMMRQGVMELSQRHRGYDGRPDAKAIINEIFGIKIKGRARVVAEGPLSISIVVTDEDDYYAIRGENDPEKKSGGFHSHYLKTWLTEPRTYGDQYTALPSDQRGLINLINGYELASSIDHENEHSLYEILIKNRGTKPNVLERLVEKARKHPQQSMDTSIEGAITELLFEANGRFISGFANEVMAYVLNNESLSSPTDYIVDSTFRRLTESKLYSHHHLTTEVIENLKQGLLNRSQALRTATPIDEQMATILQAYDAKVEETITKEKITERLKGIIAGVANLVKKYPNNKNYIRAMLAGTNPLQWSEIGYQISRGYWKHDAQPRDAKEIEIQENWRLRKQLDTANILIRMLEGDPLADDESEEQLSGDVLYQLKPGERLETTVHIGERTLFWIQNNEQRQLMDSTGQVLLRGDFRQSPKPLLVDGKIVCSVEQVVEKSQGRYSARTKNMILKEGAQKPIGLEYGDIGQAEQWQGKIIFPAELANRSWCIVDEAGNRLSQQFDNKPTITFGKDHYYVLGKQNNHLTIVNDIGAPVGPQQLTGKDTKIYVSTSDDQVYIVDDEKLYTENGKEIALPKEKFTRLELITSSHGSIVYLRDSRQEKLIFLQSGKVVTGKSITVRDHVEKKFFKVKENADGDNKSSYFIDDQGNIIGADLPQPLHDVEISSEDQCICELGERDHTSFHHLDGRKLVDVGNNAMIYTSDWKVAAFRQTDDSGQSTIMDLSGQPLFTVSGFESFWHFSDSGKQYFEGRTADNKETLMDSTGQTILDDCDDIMAVTNGQVFFKQGDQLKTLNLT